jgi:hypothetical protein
MNQIPSNEKWLPTAFSGWFSTICMMVRQSIVPNPQEENQFVYCIRAWGRRWDSRGGMQSYNLQYRQFRRFVITSPRSSPHHGQYKDVLRFDHHILFEPVLRGILGAVGSPHPDVVHIPNAPFQNNPSIVFMNKWWIHFLSLRTTSGSILNQWISPICIESQ